MVTPLPGDGCNELMRRRVIRRIIDQRASQRPCLLDTTFAQCGERRVDCLGTPSLVVRRLWVHGGSPQVFFKTIGIARARFARVSRQGIPGEAGSVKPSLQ